jgi:DNA-binding MarR family transcriptional regulator
MTRSTTAKAAAPPALKPDDEMNNRLFFRLFQASNIYERQAQRELNFSAIQGAVLGALSREPVDGIGFSDLVEYLVVSRQNLDGVLKRLEKQGFVERVENPTNRRIKMVRLTKTGARAWDDLFDASLRFYRQGSEGVTLEEKAAFVETLGRIGRSMRGIRLETAPKRKASSK